MTIQSVKLEPSWKAVLESQFSLPYWQSLTTTVRTGYLSDTVYPPAKQVFEAFSLCPLEKVRVVIVGQDPYHGAGQANGLSFSVNDGVTIPPSLKNIFREIQQDLGVTPYPSGDLSRWASQGVLLLNSVLTVKANTPASHAKMGWEQFTDAVIAALNAHRQQIVYLLWGNYAQMKGQVIDQEKNLVLKSAHPSPFSVTKFYGNHHFSQCNQYLVKQGFPPIDWR